jgi:hypothetical protein
MVFILGVKKLEEKMRHRYFKRHSDLIKHAVRMTYRRKADKAKEDKKAFLASLKKNNFLQWAAGVAQGLIR